MPTLPDVPDDLSDERAARPVSAPLNLAQSGVLASHLQEPDGSAMTISVATPVRPALDPEVFAEATRRAFAELDGVRVLVAKLDDEWRQWVGEQGGDLVVHDVRSEADPHRAADAVVERVAATTLPLDGETPLVEVHLVLVDDAESRWVTIGHHLVTDGFSAVLLRQRIADWYTHLTGRGDAPQPPEHQVAELWQVWDGERTPETVERWAETLSELPERLTLGEREGRIGAPTTRTTVSLTPEELARVVAEGTLGSWTYPAVAAVAAYTARRLEQPFVILGFPVAGRRHRVLRAQPASLARLTPLVLDVPEGATLATLSQAARRAVAAAGRLGPVAAEELRASVPAAWRLGRVFGPIVNLVPFDTEIVLPGHELRSNVMSRGPVEDLQIAIGPDGDGLQIDGVANAHAYDDGVERHIGRIGRLLALAGEHPDTPMRDLEPHLPDEEDVIAEYESSTGSQLLDARGRRAFVGMPGRVVENGVDTGRLAVLSPDGTVEDLGPADRTVVLNGHAVHLEHLRHAALEHPGVAECTTALAGRRIAVTVTCTPGADPAAVEAELKESLNDMLPLLVGVRVKATPAG